MFAFLVEYSGSANKNDIHIHQMTNVVNPLYLSSCSLSRSISHAARFSQSRGAMRPPQYEDFVDLRLAEAEKLFPEGLAGGGQGSLERARTRGTSTAVLRREAADALVHSLDGFAAAADAGGAGAEGAAEGAPPFGIEGTSSEKWRKACDARQYGNPVAAGDEDGEDGTGAADASAAASAEDSPDDVDDDDIVGDVRAAAAEGAAAAAAAAEAVTAAAVAAAGGDAGDDGGEEGSETGGGEGEKPVLGSGPIWEEMKALAESKRKPLKGVRRVVVQPGQVCIP